MMEHDVLVELTEGYVASIISEVTNAEASGLDFHAPFQELGIDSFYALKIINILDETFGTLPKTLLYENFNIHQLSCYFANNHKDTLVN